MIGRLEKITSFDLLGLKVSFHMCAQLEILVKSLLSIFVVSNVLLAMANRVVSSANMNGLHSRLFTRSLVYTRNKSGPSLLP